MLILQEKEEKIMELMEIGRRARGHGTSDAEAAHS